MVALMRIGWPCQGLDGRNGRFDEDWMVGVIASVRIGRPERWLCRGLDGLDEDFMRLPFFATCYFLVMYPVYPEARRSLLCLHHDYQGVLLDHFTFSQLKILDSKNLIPLLNFQYSWIVQSANRRSKSCTLFFSQF
jgi:hypothetical protein